MHRRALPALIPASLLLALVAGGCFNGNNGDTGDTDETSGTSGGAGSTGSGSTATTAEPTTAEPATGSTTEPATGPATGSDTGSDTTATTTEPPAEGCEGYCATITANCTGQFMQYGSPEMCLATCAAFAPGTPGDTSGNTLACRTYHAGAAADADDTHCTHAGPGGDMACGSNCEGFCAIAGAVCPDAWPDAAACNTACLNFDGAEKSDAGDVSGDTLACRLYHLTAAAINPVPHCSHIKGDSPTCK